MELNIISEGMPTETRLSSIAFNVLCLLFYITGMFI